MKNYIDFRKMLATDADFGKKFSGCKTPAELIKAAAAEGFAFTEEDIKNNTELLPEELEKAAGGVSFITISALWFPGNEYVVSI